MHGRSFSWRLLLYSSPGFTWLIGPAWSNAAADYALYGGHHEIHFPPTGCRDNNNKNDRETHGMTVFNEYEQRQIAEAIARAEQRTDAELVTVLARRADDYAYLPLLWAALLALAIPGLAHMALGWPDLRSLLVVRSDVRRPVPAAAQSTFGQPPGPAPVASAPRLGPGSATVSRAQLATHRRCYRGADLRQRGRATCGDPGRRGHCPASARAAVGCHHRPLYRAGVPGPDPAGLRRLHRSLWRAAKRTRTADLRAQRAAQPPGDPD